MYSAISLAEDDWLLGPLAFCKCCFSGIALQNWQDNQKVIELACLARLTRICCKTWS